MTTPSLQEVYQLIMTQTDQFNNIQQCQYGLSRMIDYQNNEIERRQFSIDFLSESVTRIVHHINNILDNQTTTMLTLDHLAQEQQQWQVVELETPPLLIPQQLQVIEVVEEESPLSPTSTTAIICT